VDKVALVLLEPLVSKALKELQEALEPLALALKVRRDLQEPRELLDSRELQGPQVQLEQQASVQLEQLAQADHRGGLREQEQTLSSS
jgi:hypothetical protein